MFARTRRLTLRPGWPEDAAALARAIGHESVVAKLAHAPWPYTLSDAEAFLTQPCGGHEPRFLIETMEAGAPRLVGGIDIHAAGDAREIGYWLTPEAWGRGYATEAGQAVVAMARHALGLRRLTAAHFVDNPASGRVLAKLGFRPTGRIESRASRGRGGEVKAVLFDLEFDSDRCPQMPLAA
ncbi:MAG TPA: GNAT family N-acetyltransferase [Sphingomonas sp.]|nr:GNAT family N-acetyltransferase [Sphingomonas sp.]